MAELQSNPLKFLSKNKCINLFSSYHPIESKIEGLKLTKGGTSTEPNFCLMKGGKVKTITTPMRKGYDDKIERTKTFTPGIADIWITPPLTGCYLSIVKKGHKYSMVHLQPFQTGYSCLNSMLDVTQPILGNIAHTNLISQLIDGMIEVKSKKGFTKTIIGVSENNSWKFYEQETKNSGSSQITSKALDWEIINQ
ncbi:hypothetical protein M9194_10720 [Vibrio sp. S4M6]|uniref:hypothetical protein n=1 Tax=Vibrio sinus TaxID=2946865 RepID=UPI00202AB438|nr:hypothetical protein [Vibrio sinus]MCL9781901.1 hypothetical protein [Vibrio sinus]